MNNYALILFTGENNYRNKSVVADSYTLRSGCLIFKTNGKTVAVYPIDRTVIENISAR